MLALANVLSICASVAAIAAGMLLGWLILLDNMRAAQDPAREEKLIIIGGGLGLAAIGLAALSGVLLLLHHSWWAQ
jgi:pyruvate/2-oxoacid:ferredoxin oxidoreductase beta subunit